MPRKQKQPKKTCYNPLSPEDLNFIKLIFEEKGWYGAKICREFPSKNWNPVTVNKNIKKLRETGSIHRKPGTGLYDGNRSVCTNENMEIVDDLIQSQEDQPGTHKSYSEIAIEIGGSKRSVERMVKSSGTNSFHRDWSTEIKDDAKVRRYVRAMLFVDRFPPRFIKKLVFQDETDFPLAVPTNRRNNRVFFKGKKSEIPTNRLYHPGKRQSVKLMVSCGLSWNGITKPFFLDPAVAKVNEVVYTNHLKSQLLPAIDKLYPSKDYIFVQDGASSHTSDRCQDFLLKTLKSKSRFVAADEWPPYSCDLNPLDYYFWNAIKTLVYRERIGKGSFENKEELKASIRRNWWKAINMEEVRKSIEEFIPRCKKVGEVKGEPIKHFFG